MERWSGKIAVVTGASSGIGAALSMRLATHGLTVVGLARRQQLIDPEYIAAAFQWVEQEFGGTDVLLNNAGVLKAGNITIIADNELNDENIFSTIDVNFKGLVVCTRKAITSMKKRNFNGHILNICSMDRWSGRIAVVTGASSGIGAALSVRLANHGLTVVGLARRNHRVDELCSNITGTGRLISRQCDISKVEEIAAAFQWVEDELGGTDILVNNAGVLKSGNITNIGGNELSDNNIFSTLDVNFKGLVLCTRKAMASMKKRNFDGHVVNVCSLAGHYIPFSADLNVYSATKHAVAAFSSALINELAELKSRIKVTNISPGLVLTEMMSDLPQDLPYLKADEVVDTIIYTLSTPPNVNINEIVMVSVTEKRR